MNKEEKAKLRAKINALKWHDIDDVLEIIDEFPEGNIDLLIEFKDKIKIRFSHYYTKFVSEQKKAELLAVKILDAKDVQANLDLLEYDTKYVDPNDMGSEHHTDFEGDIEHCHYPLPKTGKLIQLIFLGDKGIPFCTIRSMYGRTYLRPDVKKQNGKIMNKYDFYKNMIGEWFDIVVKTE